MRRARPRSRVPFAACAPSPVPDPVPCLATVQDRVRDKDRRKGHGSAAKAPRSGCDTVAKGGESLCKKQQRRGATNNNSNNRTRPSLLSSLSFVASCGGQFPVRPPVDPLRVRDRSHSVLQSSRRHGVDPSTLSGIRTRHGKEPRTGIEAACSSDSGPGPEPVPLPFRKPANTFRKPAN
jgi:hypothetical protein